MPKGYTFTSGNLLENPNTYFYSSFEGVGFLNSWQENRKNVLASLPDKTPFQQGKNALELEEFIKIMASGSEISANQLLSSVEECLHSEACKNNDEFIDILYRLVKSFEVHKRVYASYYKNIFVYDKQKFDDMEQYVRIADIFSYAYEKYGNIQFLNVLLKSLDVLCAYWKELDDYGKGRLTALLKKENEFVCVLAVSKGVEIC